LLTNDDDNNITFGFCLKSLDHLIAWLQNPHSTQWQSYPDTLASHSRKLQTIPSGSTSSPDRPTQPAYPRLDELLLNRSVIAHLLENGKRYLSQASTLGETLSP